MSTTTTTKKFTLFASQGPNPWKVAVVLNELGFKDDYELIMIQIAEHKAPVYTKHNPNGRTPALIDHSNNDFTIWESGAIVYYLIEKYDTEHKISFESLEEKSLAIQYLMFQMSGQGPYFGQAFWFMAYHPEQVESAKVRYLNEVDRVLGVLNNILEGKDWLVGNKFSYVDAAFFPWNNGLDFMNEKAESQGLTILANWKEKHLNVARWHQSLLDRESVKTALQVKADAVASA